MTNKLLSISTIMPNEGSTIAPTIAIATDIVDLVQLDDFVGHIAEQSKVYRTTCRPGEYMLLISIIGKRCAERFAVEWRRLANIDTVLAEYTRNLIAADVLVGTREGVILETSSLL